MYSFVMWMFHFFLLCTSTYAIVFSAVLNRVDFEKLSLFAIHVSNFFFFFFLQIIDSYMLRLLRNSGVSIIKCEWYYLSGNIPHSHVTLTVNTIFCYSSRLNWIYFELLTIHTKIILSSIFQYTVFVKSFTYYLCIYRCSWNTYTFRRGHHHDKKKVSFSVWCLNLFLHTINIDFLYVIYQSN